MWNNHSRPILVTGSHRCGSTWVGEMIASHPRVVSIFEPFNFQYPLRGSCVKQWFQHVTHAEAPQFTHYLQQLFNFPHSWWDDVKATPTPRRLAGATCRKLKSWWRLLSGCRPLMKDPIAIFSAEWLAKSFDMHVVVLIRHPAAFVSSIKRLGWRYGFHNFLNQPQLMEAYLHPFTAEFEHACRNKLDILDEAILFWRVFHHVIRQYRLKYPDWYFVRHEDLSRNPLMEYARIFAYLGLDMTPKVWHTIETHTSEENPAEAGHRVAHQLKRDSKANVWNWLKRLQPEEVLRIRKATEDVACHFYHDADWDPNYQVTRRAA